MTSRFPLTWPDGWPRTPNAQRKPAKFSTKRGSSTEQGGYRLSKSLSISDGITRVLYELRALGCRDDDILISTNIPVRLDGLPRGDAKAPDDCGIAVYWEDREGKTRVIAIDHYDRVADNLAAVAATLDALRAIERHGGARILERAFTGFDALPPPKSPFDILGVSREHASEASINVAFKAKARTYHPDAPTGSHNLMAELTDARDKALDIVRNR